MFLKKKAVHLVLYGELFFLLADATELNFNHPWQLELNITKTYLHKFDPLKPHFYIVKLGFTGVYKIFLFLLKSIDCRYLLDPPRQGGSNEYPQSMFWAEI